MITSFSCLPCRDSTPVFFDVSTACEMRLLSVEPAAPMIKLLAHAKQDDRSSYSLCVIDVLRFLENKLII